MISPDSLRRLLELDARATRAQCMAAAAAADAQAERARCNAVIVELVSELGVSPTSHKVCLVCGSVSSADKCLHGKEDPK